MRRGKSFSCSAGSLLCFLATILVLLQQTCAANNQQKCAPSSCGKITNITHPFRLKDDPATCGDPRYELACENNRTVIYLFSGKYFVEAINYKNFTIRLLDPGIQEADRSSIPRYFLSVSNFTSSYSYNQDPYQVPESVNYNYINDADPHDIDFGYQPYVIYLNCSKPVKDDPRYVDTAPFVNWHSTGHVYAIAGDLSAGDLIVDCHVKLVAMTSVFPHFNFSYENDVLNHTFSYAEIHRMLVYGFDLSWIRSPCEECKLGCFFGESQTTQNFECVVEEKDDYCTTPMGSLVRCEHLSKQRVLVEGYLFGIYQGLRLLTNMKRLTNMKEVSLTEATYIYNIGIVTGRYVLPYITVRIMFGIILFIMLLIYTCRRRHASIYGNIEEFLQGNTLMPIRYSYKQIKQMTKSFKDKLGEGGYGQVYRGKLRSGIFVAVKMLNKSNANGQEFISEVATIGRIHHSNVVRLIGFCAEGSKRALVYEFMPNGSLDKYIFSKEGSIFLTYKQIYEISLGVAHGISYLHQGCDRQILHFDIKPHNILLDENFIPKVADFGLAKLYPIDNSIVTLTAARGTIGYMAPELFYQNIGGVSYKADVYSFGMLLMEMASRRKNLNPHVEQASQLYFPLWIYDQLGENREIEMEDVIKEEMNDVVKKMFLVALWCIQLKPSDRPSMYKVAEMLEGEVENIEIPPKPLLYPHETIQEDVDINSNQTESDICSTSYVEESTTNPLLKYSA